MISRITMSETSKQGQPHGPPQTDFVVRHSTLYQEFLAEREEILRHKWLESERLGYDIGFERALLDWIRKHRDDWRRSRRQPSSRDESRPQEQGT
jgi:hypothetical protein